MTQSQNQPAVAQEAAPAACTTNCFNPRVDVWENEHEFIVHADIPGAVPGEIQLNYENGHLTLEGRVQPVENRNYLLREYGIGNYFRQFAVNDDVDASRITADYKNGVLTVKLPKREEIKPRKIAIAV
ncbi:MAG TPA: Hsp20/alpha crystallin family protein [Gemmatales bacterium]|nr:Hsp20/alpha crystallin family protein [Gemmatales bacterium]